MPNKTIYISPENEDAWNQLGNKSGIVNNMLRTSMSNVTYAAQGVAYSSGLSPKNAKTELLCKNGHLINSQTGKCLTKGCK